MSPEEFRKARPGLEAKMRRYAPRSIAFLGKRAFSAMIDQSDVELGRHPRGLLAQQPGSCPIPAGSTRPSPSTAYGDLWTVLLAEPSPRVS